MRYYSYNELAEDDVSNVVITVSEEDLRRDYYPYWYARMTEKFGKEQVDRCYSLEDCLTDWVIVNWAWEVQED